MTLFLHRAERTDLLADGLAGLLRDAPLEDPFARELVVVPARGVERWLTQRLSHQLGTGASVRDGVCAGVDFVRPRSLVSLLRGRDRDDVWEPDRLVWPLLEVIDESAGEEWCRVLSRHLGEGLTGDEADLRQGRRHAVARRLAGLFSSYAVQRPQLLADWRAGVASDGAGADLAPDLLWQPELWRRLVARVGAPSPEERHARIVAALREGDAGRPGRALDLPPRLSLFGHTRLASTEIELLGALAAHRDVHVWLPHPSDALWQDLADLRGPVGRRDDTSHHRAVHPLLATLGRDLRELQRSLGAVGFTDQALDAAEHPATLLGWLQADIAGNTVAPAGRTVRADDRSVQVHACHGAARQVDVLREVLLGLLEDDPTLEPRDIVVMCPDIETYAPLITAGFGLGDVLEDGHPAHRLRVRLADRALSSTNPVLAVLEQVLDLAAGRATASHVLDLAHAAPVRARFGFTDDDLDVLTRWVRESGVRWGFDPVHRTPYGLAGIVQNTWRFGVDRVLAGVALSDDSRTWLDATLPLDDVASHRADLAGRYAEYVDRLARLCSGLTGVRPLEEWLTTLGDGVASLTLLARDDAWQGEQLQRELARTRDAAAARGTVDLRLPDVRSLLRGVLAPRPTRANFRTGTLTVCTMVPMRSVPHRVVCLLGLDDGVFPRLGLVDGDDVLARAPRTGERDVRSEDRQLLLDAVMAAGEHLVITYTGADQYTGQPRPPAVPLGEVLDAVARTASPPPQVLVRHPLQPFDVANVTPGRLGAAGPFSFDPTVLRAARVATGERAEPASFLARPLPVDTTADVSLTDLLTFFRDPVKGYFRALDVALPWEVDGVSDAMPVQLDGLESWGVGDRMLRDMLDLVHPDRARNLEWRRGMLPPGQLGWRRATEVRAEAMELARAALTHRQTPARSYDLDIDLGGAMAGRRLTGTVHPVYGDRLVSVGFSKVDGKHLLDSWIRLLALAAGRPDHNWSALVIGRPPRGTVPASRLLGPADAEPTTLLRGLVELYDAGRAEPLPLPLKTSFAWAQARRGGDDPFAAAERRWKSARYPGEDAEPGNVRVWGAHAPLTTLLGAPRSGEEHEGETTRLGAYAARLWLPLLRNERSGL